MFVFSVLHMPFNIIFYIYGIKQVQKNSKLSMAELFNPGLIASILALGIYYFHWQLPEVLSYICTQLGNAFHSFKYVSDWNFLKLYSFIHCL